MMIPPPSSRHWLILAHCFNLDGRAASQTITDRIPLLMARGITPVVLSAPTGTKDTKFPHAQVLSPAPSGIIFELRHIIKKKIKNLLLLQTIKTIIFLSLLPFYLIEKIIIHLDSHWSWFISATITALPLIKKYRPTIVYSTAGPSSTHVTGYLLHKITKLPWLVELHDPLIHKFERGTGQRINFSRWLEKIITKNASAVIFFTESALENACHRNQGLNSKAYLLRPGANPPDFSSATYTKSNKIHFGHFGSLATGRHLGTFIQALHSVLEENPSWGDSVSLDIYGGTLDKISENYLRDYPLPGIIKRYGRLEYDQISKKSGRLQVIEAMRQCDVLVIIHGEGENCCEYIPSKLYEYLLTRRPIFGLAAPESELANILHKTHGCMCVPQQVELAHMGIKTMLERWQKDGLPDNDSSSFTIDAAVDTLLSIAEKIEPLPSKS